MLEGFAYLGIEKTIPLIKVMVAIALWNKQTKSLHFIRDHLGKKPLYAGWVDNKIAFASELKSLEKLAKTRLKIDKEAFQAYRYFGFIPAPLSIYKNIYKLPPAHWVTLHGNDLKEKKSDVLLQKKQRYWSLRKSDDVLDKTQSRAQLKPILSAAVAKRMVADVPLGAFLSGGIDSSLITAIMQEQSNKAVKTYSIGFNDHTHDESRHAEKIAKHLNTDHTTYMVTPEESLKVIPDLPQIYDEPFADYSQIPTIVLCQQAKKDTTVALSGDGGDEVFCGYKRYFMLKKLLDTARPIPKILLYPSHNIYNTLKINGK